MNLNDQWLKKCNLQATSWHIEAHKTVWLVISEWIGAMLRIDPPKIVVNPCRYTIEGGRLYAIEK